MKNFARIFSYVWPHKKRVLLSMLLAVLIGFLWSLNLSAAYPVVKVLLQGQRLGEYLDSEIRRIQQDVDKRTDRVRVLHQQREQLGKDNDSPRAVSVLKDLSRQESKLSDSSRSLLMLQWLKTYVVCWLPHDQFDTFALILGLFLFGTLLKGLFVYSQEVLVGSVVELTAMGIRKECFRKVLKLDYQTLALSGTSNLMSRFTFDLEILRNGLRLMGGKILREPLKAISCLTMAFWVNWRLALLSMVFAPLIVFLFWWLGRKLKRASKRLMEAMSQIYKTLEETFDGLKVVIAFDGARQHRQRFHRENKRYFKKSMRIIHFDALTSPSIEVLGLLAAQIALLPGAYLVLRGTDSIWGVQLSRGQMDVAQLSLLYVLLAGILDPARKLSSAYTKLKRSTAAADRLFRLLDSQSLVREPAHAKSLPCHRNSIEFRDVVFSYNQSNGIDAGGAATDDNPLVLDGVSLTVQAGEVVVVVGENGSGKSTLVNLIPRFFDPLRGSVRIDGVDTRDVRLRDLRQQIGIVTQETLLFDQTIYDNIRYGQTHATQEEVERAARRAHVASFVDELPDGYQTCVGEKGQRLSGGQRQRVALARAILRDPSILILDEATSAIDSQSEVLIHQALRDFVPGRTTFLITHSVTQSILDFVTRIVVMDRGKMVATGTHDQLLETCPIYHRLYQARIGPGAEQPIETEDPDAVDDTDSSDSVDGPQIIRLTAPRTKLGESRRSQ